MRAILLLLLLPAVLYAEAKDKLQGKAYIDYRQEVMSGNTFNELTGIKRQIMDESIRIRQLNEEFAKEFLSHEKKTDYRLWMGWKEIAKEHLDINAPIYFNAEMLLFNVMDINQEYRDTPIYSSVLSGLLVRLRDNANLSEDFKVNLICEVLKTHKWRSAGEVSTYLCDERTLPVLYRIISQASDEGKKTMLKSLTKYEKFQDESELDDANRIKAHKFVYKRMMKAIKYITDRSNQENDTDTLSGLIDAIQENIEEYLDVEAAIGENESEELLSKFQKYLGNDSSVGELMRRKNQHRPDRRKAVVQKKD